MPFALFIVAIGLIIAIVLLSTGLQKLKASVPGFTDPIRIPSNMGWSLLTAAVALNIFAYKVGFGIGYGIFGACVIASILLLFPAKKRGREVWFLGVTGMVACLLFGFRANEFIQIVNVVTALVCAGGLALLLSVDNVQWHGLWFMKMKAGFLARFLYRPLSFGFLRSHTAKGGMLVTTLKTIGITLAVLMFFSWILSSADPVFNNLIQVVRDQAVGRALFSAVLIGVFLLFLTITVPGKWQEKVPQMKAFTFIEMFVPALCLALLFGLFLGVQAKYLFASHAEFQALNMTYADYVRKGFIELLIASFAGSVISYALILKQHALEDIGKKLKLKWVNGVLLVELQLLLASAAKRDWMYVETYGLTRVRLIGGVFLLWLLGIILLIIALNYLRRMNERRLLSGTAILSALVVLLLNAVNIDGIIALSKPPRGERPDVTYMSRLSSDAVEGWLSALAESSSRYHILRTKTEFSEQEKVQLADAKVAMVFLENRFTQIAEPRPWQEWNWSRAHAIRRIEHAGYSSPLNLTRCLRSGIEDLQVFTGTDLYEQENRKIHDEHSPFMPSDDIYWPGTLEGIARTGTSSPRSCDTHEE